MGIFDIFSGTKGRQAAIDQQRFAARQMGETDQRIGNAQNTINALLAQGQQQQLGALDSSLNPSLDALRFGFDRGREAYGDARDRFAPYAETGGRAFGQYADSLGVNGGEGYDRAVGAFRASPGYQWQVDQATDGIARKAGSMGVLGSGNTMAAISDRAGNMADQEYDDYQNRLQGLGQVGYQATGAMAGLDKGIGDLGVAQGGAEAGLYGDNATRRASVFGDTTRLGVGAQTALTGQGLSAFRDYGNQIINAKQAGAAAGQQASQNSFAAILAAANLAASAMGGGGGMGGSMSSIMPLLKGNPVGSFGPR